MIATTKQAYRLLHEGTEVLSDIEQNGMRVDVAALRAEDQRLADQIREISGRLMQYEEVKQWKKIYGDKFSLGSDPQLGKLLFTVLGLKSNKTTKKGRASVDEAALGEIDLPFVKDLVALRKIEKVRTTYILNLLREQVDGVIHPSYSLVAVKSYRSSCSGPNMQNNPARNPEISALVRKKIIPRPGHCIGEFDYSALEVRIGACYHRDPAMVRYITDKTTDMHRDCSCDCYLLEPFQVSKKIRYCGKNRFVFPEFYGSYWGQVAPDLWKSIDEFRLQTEDGRDLKEWLAKKKIKCYEDFEEHIKEVERKLWEERFPVYNQWRKDWYRQYQTNGYCESLTGFRYDGYMVRNEVLNYAVQGSAFHCLLWSLIQINRWLKQNKMRTMLIGEIHDSAVFDFHPDEIEEVYRYSRKVMCEDVREHFQWINVPLEIEAEIAPVDCSWADKKKFELKEVA